MAAWQRDHFFLGVSADRSLVWYPWTESTIGFTRKRRLVAVIPLAMAFAALFVLVVDLNRPQKGLIIVGQQAMINLQSNMVRE